jgi:hypothetical protein
MAAACDDEEVPPVEEPPVEEPPVEEPPVEEPPVEEPPVEEPCTTLTYQNFGQAFFAEKCTGCHVAGGMASFAPFDSQAGIQGHVDHIIERAVDARTMPPTYSGGSGPLSDAEAGQLAEWLNCGAP